MKAGTAGGIEAVVKAINTHIGSVDVCRTGCATLLNMIINGKALIKQQIKSKNKLTVENRVKAGAAGGIEAVVKAISTHIDNAGVCEEGCWALWNMTALNGKNTDKIKQEKNEMK